jgi:hypothetical protein
MGLNFTRLLCVSTTLLFPAFPDVLLNTSCKLIVVAPLDPVTFNLECDTFRVSGRAQSNSPGNGAGAFVRVTNLKITAKEANVTGSFEFAAAFTRPAPPVFGTKRMAGTFVDAGQDLMDTLTFNARIGDKPFEGDVIGRAFLAGDADGVGFANLDGGGPFAPDVPYWLTGSLFFNLSAARDAIDPEFDVEAGSVPEPASWGLMFLGLLAISGTRMLRASRQRDAN